MSKKQSPRRATGASQAPGEGIANATPELLSTALAWLDAGGSPLKIKANGSKSPAHDEWKLYQSQPADRAEIEAWFSKGQLGLGVAMGYGDFELLDFDDTAIWREYRKAAKSLGLFRLLKRVVRGYSEETPHGVHVIWRCEAVEGSQKLAMRPARQEEWTAEEHQRVTAGKKPPMRTLIETKGHGGYVVVAPSAGKVHPEGKPYKMLDGEPATAVRITAEERRSLLDLARTFDRTPPNAPRAERGPRLADGTRPGDAYNARGPEWAEILEPHGWIYLFTTSSGLAYWRRPGKSDGWSATTGKRGDGGEDLLLVFTTSTDLDDYLTTGRTYDKFGAYTALNHDGDFAAAAQALAAEGFVDDAARGKGKRKTITDQLLALAMEHFDLGQSQTGQLFAVPKRGPNVIHLLSGANGAMGQLAMMLHEKTGRTATANALSEVKRLLEAMAARRPSEFVPMRVASRAGRDHYQVVIDMGDEIGRTIAVLPEGWKIVGRTPVKFQRSNCTEPMAEPLPAGQGSPDAMRKLFNLSDETWDFLVNWQVTTFITDIPHVMPVFEGNPGTAKTTATRFLVEIIDPSKGALNGPPRDSKALMTAASGSWAFALENVSFIRPDLSDDLSRLITGSGSRDRSLYTDGDIYVRELQRVVIMNGIHIIGMKPDLLDRSVTIPVPPIPRSDRMTDEDCRAAFDEAAPAHLSYLLDTLAAVLAVAKRGSDELPEYGRMASFERWLKYCDVVRGTNTLDWYMQQRKADSTANALDDLVVIAIQEYLSDRPDRSAEMAAATWLSVLVGPDDRGAQRQWPNTPKSFVQRLRMHSAGMQEAGWELRERTKDGRSWWRIMAPPKSPVSRE